MGGEAWEAHFDPGMGRVVQGIDNKKDPSHFHPWVSKSKKCLNPSLNPNLGSKI